MYQPINTLRVQSGEDVLYCIKNGVFDFLPLQGIVNGEVVHHLRVFHNVDGFNDTVFAIRRQDSSADFERARRDQAQHLDQRHYVRPETRARLSPAARYLLDV